MKTHGKMYLDYLGVNGMIILNWMNVVEGKYP
jgi:hypothetical protein